MLVDKGPELIIGRDETDGGTVLHTWVQAGKLYPFEYVLNKNETIAPHLRKGFIEQLATTEYKTGNNPLHSLLSSVHDDAFSVKIATILVDAYKQEMAHLFSSSDFVAPWLMEDKHGHTPLHKAILSEREKLALYFFSLDSLKFLQKSVEHLAAKVDDDDNDVDGNIDDAKIDDDGKNTDDDSVYDDTDSDDSDNDEDEDEDEDEESDSDSDNDDDVDKNEVNLLALAIKKKCPKMAEGILGIIQQNEENKELLKLVTFRDGGNVLNLAPQIVTNSDQLFTAERFLKQVVETYPQFISQIDDNGYTLLHHWIETGGVWAIKYILTKQDVNPQSKSSFIKLLDSSDAKGKQPLHLAAASKSEKDMVDMVNAFRAASCSKPKFVKLWSNSDDKGKTPLQLAISYRHQDLAILFMSMDPTLKNVEEEIMFKAINHKCHKVVKYLLDRSIKEKNRKFLKSGGHNILHAAWKSTEENGLLIVQNWPELINEENDSGEKPLETASETGTAWLVKLILREDRSSISNAPLAWVRACKNGHVSTVLAFVENSPYFRSICRDYEDTPLHHIHKASYEDLQKLLEHHSIKEMKNAQNEEDETPLHVAIKNNRRELAEVLLTAEGMNWNLKDKNNKSVKDLLTQKCKEEQEWNNMCKLAGVHPMLKAKYIESRTNLNDMRNTISVVATLLATITITAGFAVPGGVDSNGDAILSGTVTFWVFVLSNTYAMCTAVLILFCQTWSMVSDKDTSSTLIDRSLGLLTQSLYGTLVAFTLAMYTVLHKKSFWAAIVVVGMVFLVIVFAQRTVLFTILDMLQFFEDNWPPQIIKKLFSLPSFSPAERRTLLNEPDDIESQTTEDEDVTTVKKSS